jgi:hypothetical protein
MKIQVTIETVYGTRRIYPLCENAKHFAAIAGTSTLTIQAVDRIKKLGFAVEVVQPTVNL